ncbi:hypothetical protein TrCOL_g9521 [Triparma columacea]|uniref:Uncharacterized protein n=1 Tax=Triparma columacea TaxID=722753 RepID=A0A9W7GNP4_9STRA|nr:hypothetical protein TrCOL_g9521 [Triparma columacea]
MPSKSSNSVSADFLAAVTWGESSIHQSTYQAANEYLNFEPTPIPITTVDPINETNQTSDEPSVASTEAPHYYAWDLLPPPPPTTSLEPKEKKRSTKITKQANKPKPKEIRFNSAADAINPPVPPPLPPKRNSISVQDEKREKKVEINEEDEVKVLPIEVFSGDSPSNFFISPEAAWRAVPTTESSSSFKWTTGHVSTSLASAKAGSKKNKKKNNVLKNNDVTSQRVFTFRGARKVLERCKVELEEAAKLPGKIAMEESKKELEKGLKRRSSIVELSDKNIIQDTTKADAVARRRNSSVELTRMLESRPMFLPDGRTRGKGETAGKVEKALQSRSTLEELVSKNVMKCSVREEEKGRERRKSIEDLTAIITKDVAHKENKQAVVKELAAPKTKPRKKKAKATIPKREYEGNWVTMNNTAHWNYAGGKEYKTNVASARRESRVKVMSEERTKAHSKAAEDAKIAPERYYGKYGQREVWAPRYPKGMGKMDRRTTTYKRDFVWPGYRPTKNGE